MRIIVGLVGIPLGFLIIYYRKQIKDITGSFTWAETYLGAGGTYNALVLIGFLMSVLSFLYMVGTLQEILYGIFGKFLFN